MSEAESAVAQIVANALRHAGFAADIGYSGNMGKRMTRANKIKAAMAVIIGGDEAAESAATVRNLDSGEQTKVLQKDLVAYFRETMR